MLLPSSIFDCIKGVWREQFFLFHITKSFGSSYLALNFECISYCVLNRACVKLTKVHFMYHICIMILTFVIREDTKDPLLHGTDDTCKAHLSTCLKNGAIQLKWWYINLLNTRHAQVRWICILPIAIDAIKIPLRSALDTPVWYHGHNHPYKSYLTKLEYNFHERSCSSSSYEGRIRKKERER